MAIIDQWAALLGTSSQQNLSSQVYCLGRGFVKGYSAVEEPGPVITGKLMAGLIYCLLPPRSRLASSSLLCSTTTFNCFCFLLMTIIVYWILKLPLPLSLPQMPQYNNLKDFGIRWLFFGKEIPELLNSRYTDIYLHVTCTYCTYLCR